MIALRVSSYCTPLKKRFSYLVDSGFAQGIKKILHVGEEQKELVDPYLVFSFAGKKVRHFKALSKFVDCNNLSTCLVTKSRINVYS